jgi:secretion/DNA translocation related TadE-like protein
VCRDRGSVTVWAAAFIGLIWLSCSAALLYGGAVTGRHRAETAADLAALAAAAYVPDGRTIACAHAAAVAAENGGSLRGCQVLGDDVEVEVSRPVSLGGLDVRTALARARAGPAEGP